MEDALAAGLLQWSPQDLPFREIAFAILCLVLGGEHMTVIPESYLTANSTFALRSGSSSELELISRLTTGAHVQSNTPGSSPEGDIYWLGGVLVVLATQLYRPGVVEAGILRVAEYCHKNHPNECVDAILLSIEHVVLIHIFSPKEVQHSALLPLFDISNHLTMDARDRYASSYLEKLASKDEKFLKKQQKMLRKAATESMARNEGIIMHYGDSDDEEEEEEPSEAEDSALYTTQQGASGFEASTFYALVHLFDASARRHLAPTKTRNSHLPNELYAHILRYVTDRETRQACIPPVLPGRRPPHPRPHPSLVRDVRGLRGAGSDSEVVQFAEC